MKQKYVISKDNEKKALIIQEYAELDKEILSFICEQPYDLKAIRAAIKKGKRELISTLRTENMYPIGMHAEKLAASVMDVVKSKDDKLEELFFNDIDLLTKSRGPVKVTDDIENGAVEVDELLDEDESGPTYGEKDDIDKFAKSIKIADDESAEMDDEI
ncbi:MAG: hypothetical protein JRI75_04335 [Deltaproteobacteria bacterium]|nr:hypothetical protein [Deltaproteobacteria bacterium]